MRIEVHIDRVVLDGVADRRHARVIQEALRAHLTRLVTAAPEARWGESRRRLSAPSVSVDATGSPEALGRDIARSIHSGLIAPTVPKRGDR
jgi:hypothetical protein